METRFLYMGISQVVVHINEILCGDYPAYALENRKIVPLEVQDGVDPYDANVYYTYIRVYEYYKKGGWIGPDGTGTPSLLLMNYVDAEGKPTENACCTIIRNEME